MTVMTADPPALEQGTRIGRWAARGALLVVLLLIVVLAVLIIWVTQSSAERGALDPDAPSPLGTHALAVLLGTHGHPVTEVRTTDAAITRASAGPTTLVVAFPYHLAEESLRRLASLPSSVRVVLIAPDSYTLEKLAVGITADGLLLTDPVEPDCALPEARSAGDAELGGYTFSGAGLTRCYDDTLALLDRPGKAELVFLGSGEPLTNAALAERGNAALSLGLLSAGGNVVWLQQTSPESIAEGEPRSLSDLLPGWVPSVLAMLAAAAILAAFWQGRRLSAPIAEPLPVVVRSTETVAGRARLYQRARARPEAAAALRGAAVARLLPVLRLGSRPEPRVVVNAVAERSGWPADAVGAALYGRPPADDHGLVTLADALDALLAAVISTPISTEPPADTQPDVPASPDEGQPS